MTKQRATYRKYNDHSHNSSKYHKLDTENIRAKLKKEAAEEIAEALAEVDKEAA